MPHGMYCILCRFKNGWRTTQGKEKFCQSPRESHPMGLLESMQHALPMPVLSPPGLDLPHLPLCPETLPPILLHIICSHHPVHTYLCNPVLSWKPLLMPAHLIWANVADSCKRVKRLTLFNLNENLNF